MSNACKKMAFSARTGLIMSALALCSSGVFAGSVELPQEVKSRGYLLVGIESTYPPMAYKDPATNERVGFNVDLVSALAKEIGVPVKYEEMSFEQLMLAVSTGRIDVIGSAISDLPSRREKLTFVDYLNTGAQMFTTTSRGHENSQTTDFCGKKIGTPRSTSYYTETQKWGDKECAPIGKAVPEVMGISGATATRVDLKQSRLDAAVLGPEYVSYLMKEEPNTYLPIGEPIATQYFGLAVAKDHLGMRDLMVSALKEVMKNGDYQRALKKHGLESQAVTEVTIDSADSPVTQQAKEAKL